MKITLDQATLEKAVISHLKNVGVESHIASVDFRYNRKPYCVYAEVELIEAVKPKILRTEELVTEGPSEAPIVLLPIVDPETLPAIEEPIGEEPRPDAPSAPLFET